MYYIGTQEQCEAYNAKVTQGENYRGKTSKWAEVKGHPTDAKLFAIPKHPDYEGEGMELVEQLSSDWTENDFI